MKKRRSHLVPLSSQAIEILNKLKVISGKYQLVLLGSNDVRKPMSDASINKVIKMLGYHGRLTGHGFRHIMSTVLHEHGFESASIEIQFAHVDKNSISGTYNHAQYFNQRREILRWYSVFVIRQDASQ